MNKRGSTILIENIVFIVINIIFIVILIVFLSSKSQNAAVLEEKYSKEIALILDAARPGMIISLNMDDAVTAAQQNLGKNNIDNIVNITGNIVTVKLTKNGGYSYSFFNNVNLTGNYLDKSNNDYLLYVGTYP